MGRGEPKLNFPCRCKSYLYANIFRNVNDQNNNVYQAIEWKYKSIRLYRPSSFFLKLDKYKKCASIIVIKHITHNKTVNMYMKSAFLFGKIHGACTHCTKSFVKN